jgi:hypothetical protein
VGGASLNFGAKVAGGGGLRSVPPGSGLDASPAAPYDLDGIAFSAGSAIGMSLGKGVLGLGRFWSAYTSSDENGTWSR